MKSFFLSSLSIFFGTTFLQPAVAQVPLITSFIPATGEVGTVVTIQGNNFDPEIPNNMVFIGAIRAEILTANVNRLTVKVPRGANSVSPIVITNTTSQKTASTLSMRPSSFTVTYPGGKLGSNTYEQSNWIVGNSPFNICAADFNNDGKSDVATCNFDSNSVSILTRSSLNDGFNTKVDFAVGTNPRMVIASDFNGDGKPDIATASNLTIKNISVLIRNSNALGSGGFTLSNIITPYGLSAIASGDINGDGKMDLISGNYSSKNISVFLRNSANTGFVLEGNYTAFSPSGAVTNITVSDFNGDGKIDVATTNYGTNTLSVLIRNSTNTGFNSPLSYPTGVHPRGIAVGDFNGDTRSDVAVSNHESFSVSVLLRNSGNTGFNRPVHYPVGIRADWVVVGDFNGDGKSDLGVNGFRLPESTDNSNVFVLINKGNGEFENLIGYSVQGAIRAMTVGDYNADGMPDLLAANFGGNNITILGSNVAIWKGTVNNDWNISDNWLGNRVPGANSEAILTSCLTCPQLNNAIQVRRLWADNTQLTMADNSILVGEDASLRQTKIFASGSIQATDIFEFNENMIEGNLILEKTGGDDNSWSGGNHYKGELKIINTSTKTISPATLSTDIIQY